MEKVDRQRWVLKLQGLQFYDRSPDLIVPSIHPSYLDSKDPAGEFVTYAVSYNNTKGFLRDFLESSAQKISISFKVPLSEAFVAAYYFTYKGVLTVDAISKIISTKKVNFVEVYAVLTASFNSEIAKIMMRNEFNQLIKDTAGLKKEISKSLLMDHKVILISESQGNLFVNSAVNDFQNGEQLVTNTEDGLKTGVYSDYEKVIANLQIATPANSLIEKNKVVLNDEDIIRLIFLDSPSSTFNDFEDPENDPRPSVDHYVDHFIWSTYLNSENVPQGSLPGLKEFTVQSMVDTAEMLESNCGVPPVAKFTATSRASIQPNPDPMTYDFDGSVSTDEDTPVEDPNAPGPSGTLDFDIDPNGLRWLVDGRVAFSGVKTKFIFRTEGEHTVQLIVTDLAGNKSKPYLLKINVVNQAPISNFLFEVDGLKATFDSSESFDPDGKINEYYWDFGDGQFSTDRYPSHTYFLPGTYNVKLTVKDNNGKEGFSEYQVEVLSAAVGCFKNGVSAQGKVHQNPDGSMGGFVADTATVDPSVTVYEAEVCDSAQVLGGAMVFYSKITGSSVISGHVSIGGESVIHNSQIHTTTNSTIGAVIMNDSTISANTLSIGGGEIINVTLSTVIAEIHGSSVLKNSSFLGDRIFVFSSTVNDSQITNTKLSSSTVIRSSIRDSWVLNSTVTDSSLWNANLFFENMNGYVQP